MQVSSVSADSTIVDVLLKLCRVGLIKWKQANVTPVPKSGDMHLANNFRPVSVIPVLAKVFETIVHRQLYG